MRYAVTNAYCNIPMQCAQLLHVSIYHQALECTRSHKPLSSVAFGPELITLVTGSTDSASYWSRGGTTATGSFMEQVALVARRYWPAGVRQAMGLDERFPIRQHMSILMVL
jgi:hypothetical protein